MSIDQTVSAPRGQQKVLDAWSKRLRGRNFITCEDIDIPAINRELAYISLLGCEDGEFRLYMADKFTESLTAFESFLAAYPQHDYAANAQYWIGESLYSLKNYEWALDAFNKVITAHPKSNKVPDAMLKGAFAQLSMGQGGKARDMLHRLVEAYPRSVAAGKAKERLAKEQKK